MEIATPCPSPPAADADRWRCFEPFRDAIISWFYLGIAVTFEIVVAVSADDEFAFARRHSPSNSATMTPLDLSEVILVLADQQIGQFLRSRS